MKFDVRVPLVAIATLLSVFIIAAAEDKTGRDEPVHLPQGWSADTVDRWHFISQGTALFPYEWFLALEQPGQQPGQTELIRAPENLQRLGFLAAPASPTNNPDGLPIGLYRVPVDFGASTRAGKATGSGWAARAVTPDKSITAASRSVSRAALPISTSMGWSANSQRPSPGS